MTPPTPIHDSSQAGVSVRRGTAIGLLIGLSWAGPAWAQLQQPDGTSIPDQDTSADYFDLARYNVDTVGLGTLLDELENGQVDYQADATAEPGRFSPLCGIQAGLLLRGSACNMDFGWYCVDHVPTSGSDPNFVPLVTAAEVRAYHDALSGNDQQYQNDDKAFVPLIGLSPVTGSRDEAIRDHTVFQNCPSQQIGFALMPTGIVITSAGEPVCTQPKFSQASLNVVHTSGQPWISALSYASPMRPGRFYLAFEDLPSSAEAFVDPELVLSGWNADSDFNDFVFAVDGLQCDGGGQVCDTGQPGLCRFGTTSCSADGTPGSCVPARAPEPEVCDNIDNDCDGSIDNGADLCPTDTYCFLGVCVGPCSDGSFPCPAGHECDLDTDLCVRTGCRDVVCAAGQICRGGTCQAACAGVVCPAGQDCISGTCVDLCQGIACAEGFVCNRGACTADCRCLPCTAGLECGADGRCGDPACVGVTCPDGEVCVAGTCIDRCAGVTCPDGQTCVDGACTGGGTGGAGGASSEGGAAGEASAPARAGMTAGGATAAAGADPEGGSNATGGEVSAGGAESGVAGGGAGDGPVTGGSATSGSGGAEATGGINGAGTSTATGGADASGGGATGATAPTGGGAEPAGAGDGPVGGSSPSSGNDSGCGCRTHHTPTSSAAWLALLALFATARRRGRKE